MAITAQDIHKLRQLTSAGMMDCKEALTAAAGNVDKAIELLRKKGQKIANARSDRATTAGSALVGVTQPSTYGAIVTLCCETDFVAKNEKFQHIAHQILSLALSQRPGTIEELQKLSIGGTTIEEHITALISKVGENITLSGYETLSGEVVVPYVHIGNKLAVLVALEGATGDQVLIAGKNVAMQIAALQPIAIDRQHVPTTIVDKELKIAREQAVKDTKDPIIIENIAQGRLSKFLKDHTLLHQPFVKDNALTVAQYLAKVAPGLIVTAFKRVVVRA